MLKPDTEWSFTDRPDIFRICRELGEAGCCLGVSSRADGTITLVNLSAPSFARWPLPPAAIKACQYDESFPVFAGWRCFRGDLAKAFLKVSPVTVKGYR